MLRKRIIPILLIDKGDLVKTTNYKNSKYIGDPINAVKIYNEKKVDEIILLDITKSNNADKVNYNLLEDIAGECRMPFTYGGGISNLHQVKKIFSLGIEKITLNTSIIQNYSLISDVAKLYGSQSVVVSVDIKKNLFGKYCLFNWKMKKFEKLSIDKHISNCINCGAGEILINNVDKEGTASGFDDLTLNFAKISKFIPIIVNGGINSINEINRIIKNELVDAIAVGSFFVFYGPHKAVLISYIEENERLNE